MEKIFKNPNFEFLINLDVLNFDTIKIVVQNLMELACLDNLV